MGVIICLICVVATVFIGTFSIIRNSKRISELEEKYNQLQRIVIYSPAVVGAAVEQKTEKSEKLLESKKTSSPKRTKIPITVGSKTTLVFSDATPEEVVLAMNNNNLSPSETYGTSENFILTYTYCGYSVNVFFKNNKLYNVKNKN